MNQKLTHLAQRRQRLVAQAAMQRIALARNIEPFRKPLARVDQGLRIIQYVKQHPTLAIASSVLFTLLRRTRAGKFLYNAWTISKVTLNLHKVLSKN
jgi:hypothetical protein